MLARSFTLSSDSLAKITGEHSSGLRRVVRELERPSPLARGFDNGCALSVTAERRPSGISPHL
ncbi:hypothetical protein GCM10022254_44940 [Actinomadura meridiana]|uniref:Uncharacterized protein n=2 Tax=Actinomadura meridiana TaxID=559626 RepID=A0ABP8C9J3_9ACTN